MATQSTTIRPRQGKAGRPLWLLIPASVVMVLVLVIPLIIAFYISLGSLNQYTLQTWLHTEFVGIGNYIDAFVQSPVLLSFGISIAFAVLATAVTVPIGVLAAIVTQNRFRGRGIVRSLFLVPYVLPSFVVATIWRTLFQPDGPINHFLGFFGLHTGLWLNGPLTFWTLTIVEIWAAWPFVYLMALSGLQMIEQDVYEASAIDGAGWIQKLRYIVLPQLKGPIALACIIASLAHINNFTLPFVLFGVPAPSAAETLPFLTYVTSFVQLNFSQGAAISFISILLLLVPLYIYVRAVRFEFISKPAV